MAGRVREDACPVRGGQRSTARCSRSTTVACAGGSGEGRGRTCGCSRGRGRPNLWSWSPSVWCGTPLPTATFPHGLVQSRRRIRSRGRRWRVASYQRKVVEMGCSNHLPEGPRRAGGDPAPGNVATTRLPGAGVREHLAPLGALRRERAHDHHHPLVREYLAPLGALRRLNHPLCRPSQAEVREHPAPLGALRQAPTVPLLPDVPRQGAPRTVGLPSFFLRESE